MKIRIRMTIIISKIKIRPLHIQNLALIKNMVYLIEEQIEIKEKCDYQNMEDL